MNFSEDEKLDGSSSSDELEWSAFRYVADEMSLDESAEFEQRLADEQPAREAVARTVQIAHAVASLPPSVASNSDPGKYTNRRNPQWASTAVILFITAICATLAIGLRFSNVAPKENRSGDVLVGGSTYEGQDQVISKWADFNDDEVLPEPNLIVEDATSEEHSVAIFPEEISPEDDGKFDWIVAAIDSETMQNGGIENLRKEQ